MLKLDEKKYISIMGPTLVVSRHSPWNWREFNGEIINCDLFSSIVVSILAQQSLVEKKCRRSPITF